MENKIVVDFKNIVKDMEDKKLNIVFLDKRGAIFLEDDKNNLYIIEDYWCGSYLDKLIKNGEKVAFNLISKDVIKNIEYLKSESWNCLDVISFIKRQKLNKILV